MKRAHYFWPLQVTGWAGVALFVALVNRLEIILFPLSAWCGLSGLALSCAWRQLCNTRQRRGKHLTWPVAVGAAILLGVIQSVGNLEMDRFLTGPGWQGGGLPWKLILLSFWSGVMLAWNVCYMAALSLRSNQRLPLQEELSAVNAYLAIEKIRFEERLQFAIDIGKDMEAIMVPPMALQTLVENAVKYGVEPSSSGSAISIRAQRTGGTAIIEVANRGRILAGGKSAGVGVSNARKRLALSKGEHATLDLAEIDGWVRATLRFPVAA
ncbi:MULTISPECIES: sensor histidine kinase [unclassified Duganella]|uniref:sensor histidine kinase n=1 Tax=unclassified Duganella TaxID=2636909 RepID=UPI0006FAACA8|nr:MULTISPECIES: sensor histidine kinase [unclassified Duganella]KQV45543.1 hypothetical protein ASD07_18745 [Duganella sp. Root336D2]KRC00806.1 hypothetical protein ASE26_22675 [Duganella sp. Root198D2]